MCIFPFSVTIIMIFEEELTSTSSREKIGLAEK